MNSKASRVAKLIVSARERLHYSFVEPLVRKTTPLLSTKFTEEKNLFIYLDYEREFGGHDVIITDQHIDTILGILRENRIKATWFTVGRLFEAYPGSIEAIKAEGHEIASHTYSHIIPLYSSAKELENDFTQFDKVAGNKITISGFHSPNGRWSLTGLKFLARHGYAYDMVSCKNTHPSPVIISMAGTKKIVRFCTLGDDWPVFRDNYTGTEAVQFFNSLAGKLKPGAVYGIGFHPWILASETSYMDAFAQFVKYIAENKTIITNTAHHYSESLMMS